MESILITITGIIAVASLYNVYNLTGGIAIFIIAGIVIISMLYNTYVSVIKAKNKVKEAALDFVFIFGLLGALLGTYGAGNNYG